RGGGRVLPVAFEDGRAPELDLAALGDAHLDALGWLADRAEAVVVQPRAAARPGLGRAIALEDGHAEVLPGLLESRRQECTGRQEQSEVAAQLLVDAAEQARPPGHRQ